MKKLGNKLGNKLGKIEGQLNSFFAKKHNKLAIACVVIVALVVALYFCHRPKDYDFIKSKFERFEAEDLDSSMYLPESFEGSTGDVRKLVLYYLPGCPHCTVLKDGPNAVWNKLEKKYTASSQHKITKVDCDAKRDVADKLDIQGFPAIILFKNGKRTDYEGDRSLDSLEKFLNN